MASASTASVNEPTRPYFSPHRKLKPKAPISEKLVSSDISHVAFASVLLGENPSEEVDDYDNYYYEFIARNDSFWWAPEIDFRYETKARKVI